MLAATSRDSKTIRLSNNVLDVSLNADAASDCFGSARSFNISSHNNVQFLAEDACKTTLWEIQVVTAAGESGGDVVGNGGSSVKTTERSPVTISSGNSPDSTRYFRQLSDSHALGIWNITKPFPVDVVVDLTLNAQKVKIVPTFNVKVGCFVRFGGGVICFGWLSFVWSVLCKDRCRQRLNVPSLLNRGTLLKKLNLNLLVCKNRCHQSCLTMLMNNHPF